MTYTLSDLKPESNRLYDKHSKPTEDIRELENIRNKYLEKKIRYLIAKTNTTSQPKKPE